MKRTILATALTGMTITLIAPMALADRGEGPGDRTARLEMMDVNEDGQITLDEARGAFAARFAKFDTNGNGTLSQSEMAERARVKAAERSADRFATLDADGDGEVSQAEISGSRGDRVARMFRRMDANGDDILSAEELDAAKDVRGKHGGKGNGRN